MTRQQFVSAVAALLDGSEPDKVREANAALYEAILQAEPGDHPDLALVDAEAVVVQTQAQKHT